MSADRIEITSEVFWACSMHAMSTEVEEIMGLLLGDVVFAEDGTSTVRIWAVMPQIRTDRRKDRVEASPEQMARCAAVAERFSEDSQTVTRVIGWYHSHPHITVLPSHVDVRTQASYQMLDRNFVGLIISAFNEDPNTLSQSMEITAFQSVPLQDAVLPALDASDMEQAMAASAVAARSAGDWQRKEVPLSIVASVGEPEQTLTDISGLLVVLLEEEKEAYEAAMIQACDSHGRIDPITALHYSTAFQQHITSLIEIVLGPSLHTMRSCAMETDLRRRQLADLEALLQEALRFQDDAVQTHATSSTSEQESNASGSRQQPPAESWPTRESLYTASPEKAPNDVNPICKTTSATAEDIAAQLESLGLTPVGSDTESDLYHDSSYDVNAMYSTVLSAGNFQQQRHPMQQPAERTWSLGQAGRQVGPGGINRGASQHDPFSDLGQFSSLDDFGQLKRLDSPQ